MSSLIWRWCDNFSFQGATSHHLGQNFSKMFEIVFEDPDPTIQVGSIIVLPMMYSGNSI